ncbi:MAG: AlpA family transcriptional regulator [Chitinophagaceae bacterium]|nr:AlpA family transcriptional regulator [Chitinophagaceae bacterium]
METLQKIHEDLEIIKAMQFLNKRALTLDELVQYTGLAKSYLYKKTMLNEIPGASRPMGKKLFFDREKIDQWLLGSHSDIEPPMSDEEIESRAANYITTGKI